MTRKVRHLRGSLLFVATWGSLVATGCGGNELGTGSQRSPYDWPDEPRSRFATSGEDTDTGSSSGEATDTGSSPDLLAGDPNGVMMQAFYWDTPKTEGGKSWWENLGSKAEGLGEAGITAVWIPPPYKGFYGDIDVGYGVHDRYDLGELDQKGTVPTHCGMLAELEDAIPWAIWIGTGRVAINAHVWVARAGGERRLAWTERAGSKSSAKAQPRSVLPIRAFMVPALRSGC